MAAACAAAAFGCSAEAAPVTGTGGGSSGSAGVSGGVSGSAGVSGTPGFGGSAGVSGTPGFGGSSGGGSGSPGTGGGTITIDCNQSPSSAGPPLIDDIQDADNAIEKMVSMRTGWWYAFDDMTGTTTPLPAANGGGDLVPAADPEDPLNYVIHVSGSGHTVWGAGVGVGLRSGDNGKCLFDASAFTGISFRIKGTGTIRFKVPIPATIGSTDASGLGTCMSADMCFDDFGATVTLSAAWSVKTYTWADLTQAGWGIPATFTPTQLTDIQWQAPHDTSPTFDFYVDDLRFTQ